MASFGFGTPWAHTRTYSNQQKVDFDRGNGWNWNPINWPYFAQSTLAGASLTLYSNLYNLRYFYYNAGTDTYSPQFGDLSTLVHLSGSDQLQLTESDGTVILFHDLTHSTRPGGFVSMTSPGGTTLAVTQESGDKIVELQRSVTTGGVTSTESFLYEYITSGELSGHIESCTVRKRASSGDPWENVTRVGYSYYGSSDPSGSLADLRTATRQTWQNSAWIDTATDYYRYYKAGSTKGGAHDLKFVCGPEAFARLSANVGDPFTASDAQVSLFADFYYEYDGNDRVSLERMYAGSKTVTFSYTRNPRYPIIVGSSSSSSIGSTDYNVWIYKTVETQPDGSQRITFANFAGQTMLSVLKASASSSDQWCTFFRYDSQGRQIWMAQPSAVTGYDEQYDDLLHYMSASSKYEYLRDNDGLIRVTEYYTSSGSSSSSGGSSAAPDGYVKTEQIMKGQLGTPITLRSWEYTNHTEGDTTVFPVAKEIRYPDESNPSQQIITGYEYTFHAGTTQIAQQTTILPVIPTSQNGSGTSNSRKDYFDTLGYRTWSMDERGFITRYVYNTRNGALVQRIDDVDTSVVSGAPAGWSTPSGGGLNLITDFESDDRGRITQELGPAHVVDINGVATTVRQAIWTVYDDVNHTVRIGRGYATGTGPNYTFTLINPVEIHQFDKSDKPIAEILATRGSASGKLLPTDTFPQSSYVRWTTYQYTDCCLLASQRVYRLIPASGEGSPGTNYDETVFGYDVNKRRNRVVTPGGTITFTVFDPRNLPSEVFIGTDDSGASASDPTGGGVGSNNMVPVTENQFDDGQSGGDGNLTQVAQWVNGSVSRVTNGGYDWRNRLITVDGEIDYFAQGFYDNLDRLIRVDRRNTSAGGNLIARQETKFDDLSRVYQTIRYGVDPNTGTVGNALTDNTWFDPAGNVVKTLPAGSNLWTKTTFDSLNRATTVYSGYGTDASYSDIFTVTGDVILEQMETVFDDGGNAIQETRRQRYHNAPASQTGALGSPSLTPNARVTYTASYPDPLGRPQANADYGTNGGAAFTRSSTIPARSDTVLVTSQSYDDVGNLLETIDPAGMVTRFGYDAAGSRTQVIENYVASPPSSSSSSGTGCGPSADVNRTTNLTYTPDGLVGSLEAINASAGNQTTTYVYGTTLADSDVASSVLLRSVIYPDSTGGSDQVWLSYNRQAQRTSLTDQNGSVHQYDYDLLGRLTQDRVTTLAASIDGAVRRIETAYEVRGLVSRVTSNDSPAVGAGSTVNEVKFTYNDFGQSIKTYQAHSGAVDVMTTPSVQMSYANGSTNTVRPTSLTYPNGRTLSFDYGSSGGIDDSASRIETIVDDPTNGSTHLAEYSYLGLGTVAEQTSPQPAIQFTLLGNLTPDGDIYTALDRFGRVKQSLWKRSGTALSNVQYGYDRASNRTWRENPVATANSAQYDWKYGYDGLQRLKDGQRGTLNGPHTGITSPQFGQCWTLDATGNWSGFKQSNDGAAWSLEQTRTANTVNELTAINATVGEQWADPKYDANGNMTTIPRPGLNRPSWANLTTDQWAALTTDQWAEMEVAPTFRATYDAWNRLVKVTDGGNGETVQENQYDGRGYRIVSKTYTDGALSETRHAYFTDQWQCVEERLGTSSTPNRQFVWGVRYIDDLILRDRSVSGGTLNERLYALQDANWNVTAVADATGTVQERYEYDPYGLTTVLSPTFAVRTTSNFGWETTYCGYRRDAATGLYLARFRFYHPRLGVWLTRDPVGYRDSINLYEYGISNPLSLPDPYGLGFWSVVGNIALGVAVGVATVAVVAAVAPVAIAAGAAALTAVGVSAATAATVSTAAVTGTLFVAGTVGIAAIGVDTVQAIREGDYDRAGYNAGLLAGGYVAAGSGLGHRLVPAMGGKPSGAPRTWNPIRLCRYEWANRYQPNYPGGSGFFSAEYWATAPTPLSGSMTAAGTCGLPKLGSIADGE
ncbi:MAG: hypothetical protein KatS3mg114_0842 [Planctomycetaceae bacterium]|nr:MAG: hypothetical protein KatS3mg114_0842 [Planctomycetaceae bacterium]